MLRGLKIKLSMAILAALAVSAVAFKIDLDLIRHYAREQRKLSWKELTGVLTCLTVRIN